MPSRPVFNVRGTTKARRQMCLSPFLGETMQKIAFCAFLRQSCRVKPCALPINGTFRQTFHCLSSLPVSLRQSPRLPTYSDHLSNNTPKSFCTLCACDSQTRQLSVKKYAAQKYTSHNYPVNFMSKIATRVSSMYVGILRGLNCF